MRVIIKYDLMKPFEVPSVASISMKKGSEIISIGSEKNLAVLWAIIESEEDTNEMKHFALVPTGSTALDHFQIIAYLATVQLYNEQLTLHIFEIEKPSL